MSRRLLPVVVALCCTAALDAQKKNPYKDIDGDARLASIRHARIWTAGDIASKDIKAGPRLDAGFRAGEVVTCEYIEKKQTGTPKFDCAIAADDQIRVKYGETNGEIYSEVAATRLLWALGFGADRIYPVKVICKGCPDDPMKNPRKSPGTREFASAVVERKLPGDEIEFKNSSGWTWVELSFVDETSGGAPLAQRDALKLLAAMMQHTDSKPQQQRLLCLDKARGLQPREDGSCAHPFMMINDLGKTFGRANMTNGDRKSAANFEAWSNVPVWKGDRGCVAHLSRSFTGSLEHPTIGEDGRRFLAGLLTQLTDRQLRDLFEVARFTERDPKASVDDWVRVFKQKRDEIANRRCSNAKL